MAVLYEPVIGLEIHAQLLTQTKLFCGCSASFGSTPNQNVCPVCLGLPGALPVLNGQAVRMAVRAALALGCKINHDSVFARKNYFYPDLPKGYQISQYELPFSEKGRLEFELDGGLVTAGITRVHMEEDAGKTLHGLGGASAVDLNRAGVPLIEVVGDPDLRSSAQAAQYMRALREILMFIGVNDGNMEEGSFRCDANISLRPSGTSEFGTRVELKNINSFRFVQRAIDAEILRQTAVLDSGQSVTQETRSFDPATLKTRTLRSKEEAHDYRYFPEPDLPVVRLDQTLIDEEQAKVGELPRERRKRFVSELGLNENQAITLTQHPATTRFFDAAVEKFDDPVKVANTITTDVLRKARFHGLKGEFSVTPEQVAELLGLIQKGDISGKQAKEVFAAMEESGDMPAKIVGERGLKVVGNVDELEPMLKALIEKHPKEVATIRAGKKGVMGFFVGQVMKATKGSADPKIVNQLLTALIESSEEN